MPHTIFRIIFHTLWRLAIGDDEGGKVIFYAEGKEGFGLYLVGFGNLDLDDAVYIAPSLEALLIEGIGAEIFLAA